MLAKHVRPYGKRISVSLTPPGVEQNLARSRVAGGILRPDLRVELPERNPRRLAAPTGLEQFRLEGKELAYRGHCPRRDFLFEAGPEAKVADDDVEHALNLPPQREPDHAVGRSWIRIDLDALVRGGDLGGIPESVLRFERELGDPRKTVEQTAPHLVDEVLDRL